VGAGLHCIAFGTPFTEARLRTESPLDNRWIVPDPNALLDTVDTLLDETTQPNRISLSRTSPTFNVPTFNVPTCNMQR
jgi:hypothetical protein